MDLQENPFQPSSAARARVNALRGDLSRGRQLRAAVIGAGKSGLAARDLLLAKGARVEVFDDRPAERLSDDVRARLGGAPVAELAPAALERADLVVLSPGFPRRRPELSAAIERGVLVGELELAAWFVRAPLIGVTGTNGKSTTTALIAHLLTADGRRVFAGGNLGRPLSELVTSGESVDFAVVELSSYQLESVIDTSFLVAAWLNLTPDHTDRYSSLTDYTLAKQRIMERRSISGCAVLNAQDAVVAAAGHRLGGPLRWFAGSPGSELALADGTAVLDGAIAARGDERYRLDNPALPGAHNRANMAAAIECARCAGATPDGVQRGLGSFPGLPHRIELVGTARGARWYNDSKATNVDSAATALSAVEGTKILIAGGRDKGAPWDPLVRLAGPAQIRVVLAVGEAEEIAVAAFTGHVARVERCGTVERAVARAAELVQRGEAVLLSPACASLDQFTNYEARGDLFRRLVRDLEQKEGP